MTLVLNVTNLKYAYGKYDMTSKKKNNNKRLIDSNGGSRGEARGPAPLFWVKEEEMTGMKGKWPTGQVNQDPPPPSPP